jgi:hypothetical protein
VRLSVLWKDRKTTIAILTQGKSPGPEISVECNGTSKKEQVSPPMSRNNLLGWVFGVG